MLYVFIAFLIADALCWFISFHEKKKIYTVIGIVLAVLSALSLAACIILWIAIM